MPVGSAVSSMFAQIAKRYDLANHLLSGGMDRFWARALVKKAARAVPATGGVIADLATGSGDIAFSLSKKIPTAAVRGFDFCRPMLDEAEKKMAAGAGDAAKISFAFGDCMNLPLSDESVDAVTIAYGVRNFEDRTRGLGEIRRVLKPGGTAFILEFTQPWFWFRPFYYFYLKFVLPHLARAATGNKDAYDYLAGSIEKFPTKKELSAELRAAGFSEVRATGMTFSIVAIHAAKK